MDSPVIFIIFNRPDLTARAFEAIRQARPRTLLVVADGPRPQRPGEAELCAAARGVVDAVDWPCELVRNYCDLNLGCGLRVSSGIRWAFQHVSEAIVLEDDCVADPSFFRFVSELLDRYRDDGRIMMISGDNFQRGRWRGGASYYFSQLAHLWGWATWRRAWDRFDYAMRDWPVRRAEGWVGSFARTWAMQQHWTQCFDGVAQKRIDTWDYQWLYSIWSNDGLCIVPNVNMVANLGFREDATHTTFAIPRQMLPARAMEFPLHHPAAVETCDAADAFEQRTYFVGRREQLKMRLKRILSPFAGAGAGPAS